MFIGRFAIAILTLALAGSLVVKKIVPAGEGTLSDHRPLFIIWLVFVVIIIGVSVSSRPLPLAPLSSTSCLAGVRNPCRNRPGTTISWDAPAISLQAGGYRCGHETRSAPDGQEPGHVRCRSRQCPYEPALAPGLSGNGEAPAGFIGAISAWLWFTVLFANFAEALAEGRGKAQAESLRKMRQDTMAKKLYLGTRSGKAGNQSHLIILLFHLQRFTGAIFSM